MRTVSSCSDRGLGSSMCLPEEGGRWVGGGGHVIHVCNGQVTVTKNSRGMLHIDLSTPLVVLHCSVLHSGEVLNSSPEGQNQYPT